MDLYARRTDLRHGVSSMNALENILTRGGVPLQQMVASKFVASGQMLRRERSFEGIQFQARVVPVDRDVADQFSAAMRAIKDFDRAKQKAIRDITKRLKQEAKAVGEDDAIGEVGAKSTNFTSLMHNCIEQGLLAQKAEATALAAIETLQQGQKPVIAVANTMGSFIEAYASAHDLKPGDPIDVSFSDLLERYLERSRDVTIKDYRGQTTRYRLTDDELGEEGILAYEDALEWIREGDLSSIPVSPIDYITQRLERAGYAVTEVTGRTSGLDYAPNGETHYKIRPERERTPKARIDAVAQFNSGDVDVIILNCSGSTGISLHASEKFADQRPRHMIVAQAERDINVFMQMLGRVHRTGQVALPSYTLLMSDLPAEKRPGAILCRKMASLNANTTASRETDLSITSVVDFMNSYGEQVVQELLTDDLELDAKLDFPLSKAENDSSDIALIKRVTGRIPLLPIEEQEAVYDLIESEYRELVEQQRAMGESILEADQLDLDSRTLARMEVIADDSPVQSEFTGSVYLEIVDTKSSAKPLTHLQVVNTIRAEVNLQPVKHPDEHDRDEVDVRARYQANQVIQSLKAETEAYRRMITPQKKDEGAIAKFNEKLNKQLRHVQEILETYPTGTPVRIVTPASQSILYGVVVGIDPKNRPGSPAAANRWKIRMLVADSARQLTLPLSKFNTRRTNSAVVTIQEKDWFDRDIYTLFDRFQTVGRVNRQIFTGNIIKAFEKYPKGKLVNYTDHQGQVRQGLIMPKEFDIQEELTKEPVAFSEPHQVKVFITELTERQGAVKTLDEVLILKCQHRGDGFVLQAPRARDVGSKYYLDEKLIQAAGSDFYSVRDRMEVVIPPERLESTLNVLMNQRNYTLAAFDFKDIARDYLGIQLPKLEVIEAKQPRQGEAEVFGREGSTSSGLPATLAPQTEGGQQNLSSGVSSTPPLASKPSRQSQQSEDQHILPAKQQKGIIERRIVRFLQEAGIRQSVTEGEDFHLRIHNEPYIPLVVERQLNELFLTHYLEQNGDLFIDAEMVFTIEEDGQLRFKETAVQDPLRGGEQRSPDRIFAQVFSRNILEQGFAEAARMQLTEEIRPQEAIQQSQDPGNAELTVTSDYAIDTAGVDPTWDMPDGSATDETAKETPSRSDAVPFANSSASQSSQDLKALADQVRDANLEIVAVRLGLERDRHDKHKWRDAGHIISINNGKFMDWLADKGGGGAIDLVMHVQNTDFREAVQWLSRQDLTSHPEHSQQLLNPAQEPHSLQMPNPNDERWNAVRDYLVETRKLPAALIDRLHQKGMVYADDYQNAVFVRFSTRTTGDIWDRVEPTGASLRGTWGEGNSFHGLVSGSSREQGWFWIAAGQGTIQRVLLAESPIDTLSLATLDTQRKQTQGVTIYLSTDGAGTIPTEALKKLLEQGGYVAVAFDADRAGEDMAWRVAQQLPGIHRLTPAYGKDWNERLVHEGHPEHASHPQHDKETQKHLWQWHQIARHLGRPDTYLHRITEVARAVNQGNPLSQDAQKAMQRDFRQVQAHEQSHGSQSGSSAGIGKERLPASQNLSPRQAQMDMD